MLHVSTHQLTLIDAALRTNSHPMDVDLREHCGHMSATQSTSLRAYRGLAGVAVRCQGQLCHDLVPLRCRPSRHQGRKPSHRAAHPARSFHGETNPKSAPIQQGLNPKPKQLACRSSFTLWPELMNTGQIPSKLLCEIKPIASSVPPVPTRAFPAFISRTLSWVEMRQS